jgi:hypothetical protein
MKYTTTSLGLLLVVLIARSADKPGEGVPTAKETKVVGYLADVRVTGKNEKLFWNVPEGMNAVTLTKGEKDDAISYVCVWPKGEAPPARVKGGATVLIDCRLEK